MHRQKPNAPAATVCHVELVYIHELIDVIGHNRARYQQHMTANWVPTALEERGQRCLGVWSVVGSTGQWPQVLNMWELDGWDGLVRNFEVELGGGRDQDPSLAEWWAEAASLRRGGTDRIVVAEPGTRGVEALVADGVRGTAYAHELYTVPPGRAPELLSMVHDELRQLHRGFGIDHVGSYRVAMVNDTEAVVLWAIPTFTNWAELERASLAGGGGLGGWKRSMAALGADWRRILLVDAPLSPLRLGRQPAVSDQRPLDEV
jgi:hypothetical protein